MKAKSEKISTYQIMLLFIMSTLSPAIRLFPTLTAKGAEQAAWLVPAVAAIGMIVLVLIVQSFFKNSNNMNLSDVYIKVLGKIPGKIVIFIYLIYIIFLAGLYVRYYAERITSSILPETPIEFFILVMMGLVFYVLRGGLVPFVRLNELLYYVFIFIFIVTGFMTLPKVEIKNLLPICLLNALPVIKSAHVILSIWSYFIFTFFFADKINDKEHIKKLGIKAVIAAAAISTWIIIGTVGVLGKSLTARTPLPYFVSIKLISVINTLERLESVTLSLWVSADFIIITFLGYVIISILKTLFQLPGTKALSSPFVLTIFVVSIAIARNRFELEEATNLIFIPINLALGFGIPVIVFIVGKIRGIIGGSPKGATQSSSKEQSGDSAKDLTSSPSEGLTKSTAKGSSSGLTKGSSNSPSGGLPKSSNRGSSRGPSKSNEPTE